jgi:hypothetical protein
LVVGAADAASVSVRTCIDGAPIDRAVAERASVDAAIIVTRRASATSERGR